jgi:hypothetical protein
VGKWAVAAVDGKVDVQAAGSPPPPLTLASSLVPHASTQVISDDVAVVFGGEARTYKINNVGNPILVGSAHIAPQKSLYLLSASGHAVSLIAEPDDLYGAPRQRSGHTLVYDSVGRRAILYGGSCILPTYTSGAVAPWQRVTLSDVWSLSLGPGAKQWTCISCRVPCAARGPALEWHRCVRWRSR